MSSLRENRQLLSYILFVLEHLRQFPYTFVSLTAYLGSRYFPRRRVMKYISESVSPVSSRNSRFAASFSVAPGSI